MAVPTNPACASLLLKCSLKSATRPREKTLRVRLSEEEFERLKNYADDTNRMISEVIRDYIKKLPKKPSSEGRGLYPIFWVKAQTAPLNDVFPVLTGVELTVQQKIQLAELGSNTQAEIGRIVTPQQREQFRKSLAEGRGFGEALAALNISPEQRSQLETVFASVRTQLVSMLTPQQRQRILDNLRSILQLPSTP